MTEPIKWFSLFGADIYPYGVAAAVATGLGCLLLCRIWKAKTGRPIDGLRFALFALPLSLLFARAGYCAVRAGFIAVDYGTDFLYRFDLGGYSLAGASLGLLAAAALFGKVAKVNVADVLDRAFPAALLTLAGLRLAECFTMDGIGAFVDDPALQWFPMAVQDSYGEYVAPIFFWEAAAALALCAALLLWTRKTKRRRGDTTLTGMLGLGLSQVLLESLRQDNFLRFGFVRVNQLWGVALALIAILIWLARTRPSRAVGAAVSAGCAAGVAMLVLIEFGLDKSTISNTLLYAIMVLVLLMLAATGLALRNRSEKGETCNEIR
ncbi:MAG: prolipoprotein diacylglyceryl transferase [Eubacteriales bacterium]|nr:prolipoprotein diacylglyceryl transferase [Eubacteriales bacterium]